MPVKALILAKFAPEAYLTLNEGKVNEGLHRVLLEFAPKIEVKVGVPYLVTGDFDLVIDLEALDLEKVADFVLALRQIPASSLAIEETRTVIYLKPVPHFASSMTARSR